MALVKAADSIVFPTPVGVFLKPGAGHALNQGLPHARGGVSFSDR